MYNDAGVSVLHSYTYTSFIVRRPLTVPTFTETYFQVCSKADFLGVDGMESHSFCSMPTVPFPSVPEFRWLVIFGTLLPYLLTVGFTALRK